MKGPQLMKAAASDDESILPVISGRLRAFRSLGGNCEFGFVQRYGGVEPSGLLRFSYTPISDLIHALDTNFSEYGASGDLQIELADSGMYYCRSRKYNIWSNTAQNKDSFDPNELLQREYGRIDHLRKRMLKELAAGSKIWVRKLGQSETEAELDHLAAAVARHGPSTLLLVSEVGTDWRPAPVRQIRDHVYVGNVRRFAPTEAAWNVDLAPWLMLCDSAYARRFDTSESEVRPAVSETVIALKAGLRLHQGKHQIHSLTPYMRAVEPAAFDPRKVYVFSTWVWIPEACAATEIFAVTGQERLGWVSADFALRNVWQRVWAAGRFQEDGTRAPVGLGMIGSARDRFWSYRAGLHEGVVPPFTEQPTIIPEPAMARWLTRLWKRRSAAP